MSDVPDYSGEEEKPAEDSLHRLRGMALTMIQLQEKMATLSAELEVYDADYKRYSNSLIPELMKEIGLNEIKLTNSFTIKLKQSVHASLPSDERKDVWMAYLKDTGNDGLVKRSFVIDFGREEITWAETFKQALTDMNVGEHADVSQKETIHNSTLVSFITKELEAGRLSDELMKAFGAIATTSAKIESKKKR